MKSLAVIFILFTGVMQAQNLRVLSNDRLTALSDGEFIVSAVSPDNKSILASHPGNRGLYIINVSKKTILKISEQPGAGYEPCFSEDGSNVFFRSDEMTGMKKYSSLSEYDLNSGKTQLVEKNSRELTTPLVFNNELIYSVDGKRRTRAVTPKGLRTGSDSVYLVLENLLPVLYINGIRKPITPSGEGNYIWVSLSPDKSMLLYNFRGSGTFVSTLGGVILADLGRINYPGWLNNEIIIGMNDKDDGYRVISSDILCYSLSTKRFTNLTATPGKIEMYPLALRKVNKIVYQTLEGELFIMTLNVK